MTETESDYMNFTLDKWTDDDYRNLINFLIDNQDMKYRDFSASLEPNVNQPYARIGIRIPFMRAIAKEIAKGDAYGFLDISSNEYYETRMIRGIVAGLIKTQSFEEFTSLCELVSTDIDSWSLCDCFCCGLKQVKRYKDEFFDYIENYLLSGDVWKKRIALVVMLNYYLEDKYIDRVFKRCDSIKSDFYYVNMAQAWLVATAFVKCEEQTREYLLNNNLSEFTFNKAIQKCIESRRIDAETKLYLKSRQWPATVRADSTI